MSWSEYSAYSIAAVAIAATTLLVLLWLAHSLLLSKTPAIQLKTTEKQIDDFDRHWKDAHGTPIAVAAFERRRWLSHIVIALLAATGLALDVVRWIPTLSTPVPDAFPLISANIALRSLTVVVALIGGIAEPARMLALTLLQIVFLTTHLLTFLQQWRLYQEAEYYAQTALSAINILSALCAFVVAVFSPTGPNVELDAMGKLAPRSMVRSMMGGGSVYDFLLGFLSLPILKTALLQHKVDQDTVPGLDAHLRSAIVAEQIIEIYRDKLARSHEKYPAGKRSDARKALTLLSAMLKANASMLIQQFLVITITCFSFYAPKLGLSLVLDAIEDYTSQLQKSGQKDSVAGRARATLLYSAIFYLVVFWEAFIVYICWINVYVSFRCLFQVQFTTLLAWKRLRQKESSGTLPENPASEASEAEDGSVPSSSSQVLNLVTTDVYRIANKTEMLSFGYMGPLEIFVGGYSAYLLLGKGAILGLATAALLQPIALYLGNLTKKIDNTLQKTRDRRVMLLSETIKAMRMVKYQAWEDEMAEKIMQARKAELRCQAKSWAIYTFFSGFFALTPVTVIVVSFGYYTLVDKHTLTAAVAFPAVAVLMELRWAVSLLPEIFLAYIQAWNSLKRISIYLETGDIDLPLQSPHSSAVALHDAEVSWTTDSIPRQDPTQQTPLLEPSRSTPFVLSLKGDIEFDVGKLNLVCGKIGSGKTLLLLSLLGETQLLSGRISCPRSHPSSTFLASKKRPSSDTSADAIDFDLVAYAPQRPFLFNASVRDNILFGLQYNKRRYTDVVFACGLRPDFSMLKDGDRTEIGEGGINLSGGQKARVSLARAVYSRAGTILIDDCLSALDSHTTKHVCEHLFDLESDQPRRRAALLKGRTVILVTHHVPLVAPRASKVLMLVDGKVGFTGKSDTFLNSEHYNGLQKALADDESATLVASEESSSQLDLDESAPSSDNEEPTAEEAEPAKLAAESHVTVRRARASSSAFSRVTEASEAEEGDGDDVYRQISEEKRAVGRVSTAAYTSYIRAGGGYLLWSLILLGFSSNALLDLVANWWLRNWSSASESTGEQHSTEWWLYRWMAIQLLQIVGLTIATALVCVASLLAGSRLFKKLLRTVLAAPLRFHDSVPSGRLLNRFGKDMESIDSSLAPEIDDATKGLLLALAALIATWLGGGYQVLVILLVMAPLFYLITVTFTIASRDLKRLDATTSSHRLSAFTDLVSGVVTIRAFGASSAYMSTLLEKLDENLVFFFWQGTVRQWQTFLFGMVTSGFVISTLLIVTLTPGFTAARAGFTLSFVQNLIWTLQYGLRSATNVEQSLVSVERVLEYTDLETEPLHAGPGVQSVPANWPQEGKIEIKDLRLRYAPTLPDVLKGITLSIKPGEKVGIVGSTGSGKSTLVSALFRFFEYHAGSINIDGVDIGNVALKDLRSRMQIVPQDPLILSGTLRSAVDPVGQYEDEEIAAVLRTVGLLSGASGTQTPANGYSTFEDESGTLGSLDSPIQESGGNLSSGQKQLVSLSRILLSTVTADDSPYKANVGKIVVLDESTSSIDYQTDRKIQTLLAAHFQRHSTTVLAIAHRLRSIIDYDTVIVLDQGQIVEQGNPKQLLQNQDGPFQKLAKDTGAEYEALRRLVGL